MIYHEEQNRKKSLHCFLFLHNSDHIVNGLNHIHLSSPGFSRSEVWAWLSWILCSGSHIVEIKMSAGAAISSKAHSSLLCLFILLAEFMYL